ncbi:hypothetical protein [Agromyces sp. CCNWLW203]|uniref:hypothetical protein n=1 Tax=Agromyces sp. CCNWLW203 TaxID=3112842 RepID=UPI002F9655F6
MTWPPIDRDDLRAASASAGFDLTLPILIRRLIAETATGLLDLDMPGESGVAAAGFDGVATTSGVTTHVPGGTSVWELSVGGNDTKANDDYSKRTKGPPGTRARDCTYVEVILAPWTKSRTWAGDKNKLRRWREVRAYNLDRVHLWLESAPATTAWLAAKLGKAMPGVRALREWWTDTWIPSTEPSLGIEIVLAGRADSMKALVDRIAAGSRVTSIGGGLRLEEAMALVAASLTVSDQAVSETLLARTLVVHDYNSLERLVAQPSPLIILLADPSLARDLPVNHPHQLLVLAPPGDSTAIEVERLSSDAVARAFAGEPSATELGYLARRSLLALRRRLAVVPGLYTPAWAISPGPLVRRLSLTGSWRSEQVGDRAILEAIASEPYSQVLFQAQTLRTGDDMPFLDVVQDEWYVVAREDAWSLLAGSLTMEDLRAVEGGALQVFEATDPVLELDPDERWKASLNGVFRPHSPSLRRGLAEYVALAGASDSVINGTSNRHSDFARMLARRIFESANGDYTYQLWSSLTDVVGLLAEGAPEEFLVAMRAGLTGASPIHAQMFQDSEANQGIFGRSSPHSSFLWALEALAWSPDFVDDVVRILVALDALDPGGELSNRPRASLLGILSVWSPQTSARLEQRLRCIDLVVDRGEDAAAVLLELVPNGHGWQMSHSGPTFRDWRAEVSMTNGAIREALDHISDALIERFDLSSSLALAVVPRLNDFGSDFRVEFANKLAAVAPAWGASDRALVYESLREFVAKHKEYADAAWALSAAELAEIGALRDRVEPSEPSLKYRWLFKQAWITLGDLGRRDDLRAFEAEVAARRRSAVEEIFSAGGLEGVIDFAAQVDPWLVGLSLGNTEAPVERVVLVMLPGESTSVSSLAAGLFSVRLRQEPSLVDQLLEDFPAAAIQAFLLRYLPDQDDAQRRLDSLAPEVSEIYWQNFNYFGLGQEYSQAKAAGWNLVDAGRPVAALMLNLLYLREGPADEETAELFATALEALLAKPEPDPEIQNLQQYELERVFSALSEHRDHLTPQRVVALEWQLLPLSSLDGRAPALHAEIRSNPEFFVELVVACFRPAHGVPSAESGLGESADGAEPDEIDESTEQQRAVAGRAWEVLRSCDQVPGVQIDRSHDVPALERWISTARTGLAVADRVVIGDLQIGELLSHAPRNEDGSPFSPALRDLLEHLASDEIMRGIATGMFNSRGITSRDLNEGGGQEWQLVEMYRAYAEEARSWPLTRRLLEGIAERYEADARREDLSAERRKQGLR